MANGEDVRAIREQRSALRGPSGRGRMRTEGQFKQYYEDLGASTTPEQYGDWKTSEDLYQSNLKKQQSALSAAKQQYGKAAGDLEKSYDQLPGVREALDKSYSSFSKKFVPIRVVDPSGNNVEATYMLPKEVVPTLQEKLGGFAQNWVDDGKNYNISVRHETGRIRGQEIHDALRGATQDVKTDFYSQALPQVTKELGYAKEQLSGYSDQLSTYGGQIAEREAQIARAQSKHDAELKLVRDEYQNKLNTMQKIFGGLKVGKGNDNDG